MRARLGAPLLAAAICCALATGAGALGSTNRVDSARYVGGMGDVEAFEVSCSRDHVNVGGACFDVQPKDLVAEISVADELGAPVAWTYELREPDGSVHTPRTLVCKSVFLLELPEAFSGTLRVTTTTLAGRLECSDPRIVPATSGIVAVGFYDEDDL